MENADCSKQYFPRNVYHHHRREELVQLAGAGVVPHHNREAAAVQTQAVRLHFHSISPPVTVLNVQRNFQAILIIDFYRFNLGLH